MRSARISGVAADVGNESCIPFAKSLERVDCWNHQDVEYVERTRQSMFAIGLAPERREQAKKDCQSSLFSAGTRIVAGGSDTNNVTPGGRHDESKDPARIHAILEEDERTR